VRLAGTVPGRRKCVSDFRRVLEDFHERFRKHAEPWRNTDTLMTRKFYQIDEWDEQRYAHLVAQYDFHVDLVEDLMLELSRAANLVCDRVRCHLIRGYRCAEGRLLVQTGPTMDLAFHDAVVEYDQDERTRQSPYPGLQTFLIEREQRDMYFGNGAEL